MIIEVPPPLVVPKPPEPGEPARPLLTEGFANQVFGVSADFASDLPVASLIAWSDAKREAVGVSLASEINTRTALLRRHSAENPGYRERVEAIEALSRRLERLGSLPKAPDSWRSLVRDLDAPHKRVLIQAISAQTREQPGSFGHGWIDSAKTVEDLRGIEVSEEYERDPHGSLERKFLARAF